MKRKPSPVSVVLFILLFVMLYFIERELHILSSPVDANIDLKVEEVPLGQANHQLKIIG